MGKWFSASTREFVREAKSQPGFSWFDFIHGYFYSRWPYFYIGVGTGEHRLARIAAPLVAWIGKLLTWGARREARDREGTVTFADTYHGKVVPLEAASQLVTIKEDIRIPDLEQVIPYTRARAIIMRNPDHIVALDCPCRMARENPCLPLDVCLIVGEPFASFVLEHLPNHTRGITPAEAVEILKAEDERGHVHHAFFKDAMLGRFYAICNCCSCCCGAMQAHQNGVPMLAASGYRCQVDAELCVGCRVCAETCQFSALTLVDGIMTVAPEACMGCGVCVSKCPQGALSLARDEGKGIPLEIQALLEQCTDTAAEPYPQAGTATG